MGIQHVWTILTPFCERKPLHELQGKTVAVDLSCWICEAQNVADHHVQPKMYLRNLYFRTCFLLLMDVNPVFVLEGQAPELKYDTMTARNAIQFKGAKIKDSNVGNNKGKNRSRFKSILKYCEEMLKHMGLACVQSKGEAEALCAFLNDKNLVDGCISQDSDCFAYGAKIVYRNFSISHQGASGFVDIYNMQKIQKEIDFGRNKIIALAVLCGSDYSSGVFGVGKEAVSKLYENVAEKEILNRLRSWKNNNLKYDELYKKITNKNICTSCGHKGKLQVHTKSGCTVCQIYPGCDSSLFKDQREIIKNEIGIRSKALVDPTFPNENLIEEFINNKESILKIDLKWKRPDLIKFICFTTKHLDWESIYAFEKFLPILTRWQLINYELLQKECNDKTILAAKLIKKKRNPKGVPSYEIIWEDSQNYYKKYISEDEQVFNDVKLWSTIEPQTLVLQAMPVLVQTFIESKMKPKRTRKAKATTKSKENNSEALLTKPQAKKVKRKCTDLTTQKIDVCLTKLDVNTNQFDLDSSQLQDDTAHDLSDIIESIINDTSPKYLKETLRKCGYTKAMSNSKELNKSSFFITDVVQEDLFEKSMNNRTIVLSDSSDTEEVADDTFVDNYVPLLLRLKNKS